jgi:hypothetical protein
MNNNENTFGKNIAKLIITSASVFMGWNDNRRDSILNDVAKDVSSRVLGGESKMKNNNNNRNRNRNRKNRAKRPQQPSV